ncbi:uncharacterized protein LOC131025937 [Salvia miltiorrhiza]|uniref:uncharacterized protein LOC131025937 n=1 Tax=Salvia miltiorrhiza TaxID=226208 RepID=UPI0025AC7D7A|nr:uncharacterized protein LOC131025937 [Salvia miltiorrhiza]
MAYWIYEVSALAVSTLVFSSALAAFSALAAKSELILFSTLAIVPELSSSKNSCKGVFAEDRAGDSESDSARTDGDYSDSDLPEQSVEEKGPELPANSDSESSEQTTKTEEGSSDHTEQTTDTAEHIVETKEDESGRIIADLRTRADQNASSAGSSSADSSSAYASSALASSEQTSSTLPSSALPSSALLSSEKACHTELPLDEQVGARKPAQELKEPPDNLKHVFLEENKEKPRFRSAELSREKDGMLLKDVFEPGAAELYAKNAKENFRGDGHSMKSSYGHLSTLMVVESQALHDPD